MARRVPRGVLVTTSSIDATITTLRRTQKRGVEYTVEFRDAGGDHVVTGKSSVLWSALIPHGFDVDTATDGIHEVSIPCEFDGRRIVNIPMLKRIVEAPSAPRPVGRIEVKVRPTPAKRGYGMASWLTIAVALLAVVTLAVRISARN